MKTNFKVIIAGSRYFKNYNLLKEKCNYYLQNIKKDIIIISGTAKGADQLGERYAKEKGYEIEYFKPDWSAGKVAGHLRNKKMAEAADALILFWDGNSKGSFNMKQNAIKCNIKIKEIINEII